MQRKHTIVATVTLIIVFFVLLHYADWLSAPERLFRSGINATSSFVFNVSHAGKVKLGSFFSDKLELSDKVAALEIELNNSLVDKAKLILLGEENTELREQLYFSTTTHERGVGAEAIGRGIDPIATTIIINKGSRDGIEVGRAAIVGTGVFIGKVLQVYENSSIIQLVNDTQSRIAATILNHDHSLGIVEGGFGISVRMKFIPQNEGVKPGDIITTSGLQENIPRGLVIGTVEAVEKKPQEPFQQAILRPLHNLNDISVVTVLVSK